jgi:hypothetical protein
MTTFLIPARIVLGVYLVIDNILPFLTSPAEGSGVAHGAHIGGFLAGLGFALAVDRWPRVLRKEAPAPGLKPKRTDLTDAVTDIAQAIYRHDLAHAAARFSELDSRSQRNLLSTADIHTIGEYLLNSGAATQALTVFRRLIAERPGDTNLDRAYLGAGRAMLLKDRCETAAWHYFLAAIDLAQTPDVADEARRYMKMIKGRADN